MSRHNEPKLYYRYTSSTILQKKHIEIFKISAIGIDLEVSCNMQLERKIYFEHPKMY